MLELRKYFRQAIQRRTKSFKSNHISLTPAKNMHTYILYVGRLYIAVNLSTDPQPSYQAVIVLLIIFSVVIPP